MPTRRYVLTKENRSRFQEFYLLYMLGNGTTFPMLLPGELGLLKPLLEKLHMQDLVTLNANHHYAIASEGEKDLALFRKRYQDYLQMFDVYCAVDLGVGEFAFASILKMTPEQFKHFLQEGRWEDLRVAVAVYKGLNPLEIVFMSFLNEGRFSQKRGTGWCLDLLGDLVWDEMLNVCKTALHPDDLGEEDVIEDIIRQGSQLMVDLLEERAAVVPSPQAALVPSTLSAAPIQTQVVPAQTVVREEIVEVEEITSYTVIDRGGYLYPYDIGYVSSPRYVAPIWYEPYWRY